MNDHDGGRRPSFLGRWLGRLIGVGCVLLAAYLTVKGSS